MSKLARSTGSGIGADRLRPPYFLRFCMTNYPDLKLYVGGSWRGTADSLPVLNPADESVYWPSACSEPR